MPPIVLLLIVCVISAAALSLAGWSDHRQRRVLQRLAVERRLNFSRRDLLRLGPRVAPALATPGAAGICITNLLYGSAAGAHRYIFTVEYTIGAVRSRQRVRRVAAFAEPRERPLGGEPAVTLAVASAELPLVEQYRFLLD